jgi:CelD/BcsL family acetyltransferase involved in cellulose biosynthesis
LASTETAALGPTRAGRAPVAVEEVSDRAALDALAGEWASLDDRAADPNFFSTWEWMSSWLDSFHESRPLSVLLARRDGSLVGVLPLVGGTGGRLCRVGLQTPANAQTPVGGLAYEGSPAPILAAFVEHIRRTRGRVALKLPLLASDCAAVAVSDEVAASHGSGLHRRPSRSSSRIVVRGSWADHVATRSKHVQREWRRKRKRLEDAGRVEARLVTAPADVPAALREILEIESHSWKHEEGTSLQREAGVADFYARLAERCAARGWLRLSLLCLDGRPAAHCLAVAYGGELLALKTSFDSRLASLSPGLALVLAVCEQAFAEGLAAIDLLGDPVRWKREIANEERAYVDVCVFPRGLVRCEACVLLRERLGPALRTSLPPSVKRVGRRLVAPLRSDD